ncbi:tyrosine-protein phosphatase non-receptor type 61F isoform X2 [Atheta coriaria]|uniref:tyrosine-protein phosphatase non-receptor type 61F isoform X2 n=1 Tax=Dalotia coriaria TaxID=877792 RepID=UPI0031F43DA7
MTNAANSIEIEYAELNQKDGWPGFYQQIRVASANNAHAATESIKPENKVLNRYRDVMPYDHSRIVLKKGDTDYINANIVSVKRAGRSYILTQGPLCNTVSHFWLMIWEQRSRAVLMLNKLIEKKQEKCYQYWPAKTGKDHMLKLDDVGLTVEYTEYHDYSHYLTRTLRLTDVESEESRDIIQFHYTTWPDFGVPSSPTAFLQFLRKVREAGVLDENVGPAVVHCSAGIGRSGTFCLVDSCLVLIEQFGVNEVDVKQILLEMRQYRIGLIQTPEQLRFSYQAIIEGAKKLLNKNSNNIDDENCNENDTEIICNSTEEVPEAHSSDEEEPPPLPPPRNDSLRNAAVAAGDRPLPTIPNSTSLSDFTYEDSDSEKEPCPDGPLPTVPGEDEDGSSVDELEDETEQDQTESPRSEESDKPNSERCLSPATELRQRKRLERNEQLAAQVRDMKRRQQANEQWTQFKRPKTTLPD